MSKPASNDYNALLALQHCGITGALVRLSPIQTEEHGPLINVGLLRGPTNMVMLVNEVDFTTAIEKVAAKLIEDQWRGPPGESKRRFHA